jgi:peroxin-14
LAKHVKESTSAVQEEVASMKLAEKEREDTLKNLQDEIEGIKSLIPKMMEKQKDAHVGLIQDLQNEVSSLKSLLSNRKIISGQKESSDSSSGGALNLISGKKGIPAWQLEQHSNKAEEEQSNE